MSLQLRPRGPRGGRRAGVHPCTGARALARVLRGPRRRRGRASWGTRAFVCAPAGARPPRFPAHSALTCPELEFFVWGGARPAEAVPRIRAEAAPRVGSSKTKRAVTSARGQDWAPQGS